MQTTPITLFESVMSQIELARLFASRTKLGQQLAKAIEAAWARSPVRVDSALIPAIQMASCSRYEAIHDQTWTLELAQHHVLHASSEVDWAEVRRLLFQVQDATESVALEQIKVQS